MAENHCSSVHVWGEEGKRIIFCFLYSERAVSSPTCLQGRCAHCYSRISRVTRLLFKWNFRHTPSLHKGLELDTPLATRDPGLHFTLSVSTNILHPRESGMFRILKVREMEKCLKSFKIQNSIALKPGQVGPLCWALSLSPPFSPLPPPTRSFQVPSLKFSKVPFQRLELVPDTSPIGLRMYPMLKSKGTLEVTRPSPLTIQVREQSGGSSSVPSVRSLVIRRWKEKY